MSQTPEIIQELYHELVNVREELAKAQQEQRKLREQLLQSVDRAKLEETQALLLAAETARQAAEDGSTELSRLLSESSGQMHKLQDRISELESNPAAPPSEDASLRQQLEELKADLEKARASGGSDEALEAERERATTLESLLEDSQETINSLEKRISELQAAGASESRGGGNDASQELEALQELVKKYQEELQRIPELERKLVEASERPPAADASLELEEARAKIARLESAASQAEQAEILARQLSDALSKIQALDEDNKLRQGLVEDLEKQLREAREHIRSHESERETARELERQLGESKLDLERQLADARAQLAGGSEMEERFRSREQGLEKELEEAVERARRFEDEASQLQSELSERREQVQKLEGRVAELAPLAEERDKLEGEVARLSMEIEDLQAQLLEKSVPPPELAELEPLRAELKAARRKITDLQSDLDDHAMALETSEDQVSFFQDEVEDREAVIDSLRRQTAGYLDKLRLAQDKLYSVGEAVAERNRWLRQLQDQSRNLSTKCRTWETLYLQSKARQTELEGELKVAKQQVDDLKWELEETQANLNEISGLSHKTQSDVPAVRTAVKEG